MSPLSNYNCRGDVVQRHRLDLDLHPLLSFKSLFEASDDIRYERPWGWRGELQAITEARTQAAEHEAAGLSQAELDAAARHGLQQGAFEESPEKGAAIVEEFYSEPDGAGSDASSPPARKTPSSAAPKPSPSPTLTAKLTQALAAAQDQAATSVS